MDPVPEVFPLWVIALDYISGVVMWTLIGRTAMGFFLPEDSSFFFMRFFVRSTNPFLRFFAPVTPGFLLPALVPLSLGNTAWVHLIGPFKTIESTVEPEIALL